MRAAAAAPHLHSPEALYFGLPFLYSTEVCPEPESSHKGFWFQKEKAGKTCVFVEWNKGEPDCKKQGFRSPHASVKTELGGCFFPVEFVHWSQDSKYSTASGCRHLPPCCMGCTGFLPQCSCHPDRALDMNDSGTGKEGGNHSKSCLLPSLPDQADQRPSMLFSLLTACGSQSKGLNTKSPEAGQRGKEETEKIMAFSSTHKIGARNLSQVYFCTRPDWGRDEPATKKCALDWEIKPATLQSMG